MSAYETDDYSADQVPAPERRIVYVVDDNADVRKSLHFALTSVGITVWPFGTPEDFLDSLGDLAPAPILLDVRMPKIDGIQLLQILRERSVDWPVIMMTAHGDIPIAVASMKHGAFDFLEKPFAVEHLEEQLYAAYEKTAEVIATSNYRRRSIAAVASLSAREKQVALAVAAGRANKEIAEELGISPRTVEIHRSAVLRKMNVKSAAEVVRLLMAAGAS